MLIGQIFKESLGLKDEELNRALELQKELGGRIGQVLIQMGAITDTQLIEALSQQMNVPLYDGDRGEDETLAAFLAETLDLDFLVRNSFLPFKVDHERKILSVVTNDPLNTSLADYVTKNLKYRVDYALATEQTIKGLSRNFAYKADRDFVSLAVEDNAEKLKEMAFEAPVIKYLNGLLSKAVELKASDIHIESSEKRYRVRFRIDGLLHDMDTLEETFYLATVSRIKLLSGLDIAEKRLPQDGKFSTKIASALLDIRISTIPMIRGEGVVLRLLYRERLTFDIKTLGLEKDYEDIVIRLISNPYGIFLVTGPTGSGKTTTL
jgi:type II secretory ATPase GspE/PulE/Tfp pilus assembly ATPase PilB-like protein